MSEKAAQAFQVWFFICPDCSDQVEIGEDLTGDPEECPSCGASVEVTP